MRTCFIAPTLALAALIAATACTPDPGPGPDPEPGVCIDGTVAEASAWLPSPIFFSADSSTMAIVLDEGDAARAEWRDLETGETGTLGSVDKPGDLQVRPNGDGTQFLAAEVSGLELGEFHVAIRILDRDANVLAAPTAPPDWQLGPVANNDLTRVVAQSISTDPPTARFGYLDVASETVREFATATEQTSLFPVAFDPEFESVLYVAASEARLINTADGTTIRSFERDEWWQVSAGFLDADTVFFRGTIPSEVDAPEGSAVIYRISTDSFEIVEPPEPGANAIAATPDLESVAFVTGGERLIHLSPSGTTEHAVQASADTQFRPTPNLDRVVYRSWSDEWVQLCLG